jgi:mannose-6-phosphate isomerase-like protein (cupin superfamily)
MKRQARKEPVAGRRRFLPVLAALPAAVAMPAFAAIGDKLGNETLGGAAAQLIKHDFGDLRIYFDGATDQIRFMTAGSLMLKRGKTPHPPHEHPEEEFMVVTEGTGEIFVDGKTTKVGLGSMMYCAARKFHGIVNTGKTPLLFYFFKWRA